MEPLKIRKYPNKTLRQKCGLVKNITQEELDLFGNMLFSMKHFGGIGLAAPQIGISKRLIVADTGEGPVKLANPKILNKKGTDNMVEGCLSVPDTSVDIKRAYAIIVSGMNEKAELVELKAEGLLARVLQHEIDHLNGKLIIDY